MKTLQRYIGRDVLTATLTKAGFDVLQPEGTFYLWSKWPAGDPEQHWNGLADRKVFVMPGSVMGSPNHLRISLTASDRMVEQALPAFRARRMPRVELVVRNSMQLVRWEMGLEPHTDADMARVMNETLGFLAAASA